MRKWIMSAAAATLLLAFAAGCGTNRNDMQPMQRSQNQGQQLHQINNQQNQVAPADERVEVAQAAADSIAKLPGVRQANVLVTSRNAYVAAVLDDTDGKLTRQMEDKIAREVRKVRPGIQNVYVSTNPDFVERINSYMIDVQQGRPIAGLADQLNEMVQRIFPDAR